MVRPHRAPPLFGFGPNAAGGWRMVAYRHTRRARALGRRGPGRSPMGGSGCYLPSVSTQMDWGSRTRGTTLSSTTIS